MIKQTHWVGRLLGLSHYKLLVKITATHKQSASTQRTAFIFFRNNQYVVQTMPCRFVDAEPILLGCNFIALVGYHSELDILVER